MDPVGQQQQPQGEQPELNAFGKLTAQFLQYGANASNNISNAFESMDTKAWIRLTVIVGGYMLLRPLFLKFVTKGAVQKMEDEDAREKRKAQISPNELRGLVEDEPEIDEEGDGTGADWGQKARVRQRTMLKDLLEAEERRREEEEDDKDIADLLED
ncbi:trafficking PGA2 domain protein [Fusarium beomiforme]|uniref:Trafficking PGA2 domain protein n=1 Tax=Fusarium beomiforme TaxID=44412 RepID=A0A9P5A547_9HYPO|nr:trafficking PGA2 domain protein [Fusarium beomiforme]